MNDPQNNAVKNNKLFTFTFLASLVLHSTLFMSLPQRIIQPLIPPQPVEVFYEHVLDVARTEKEIAPQKTKEISQAPRPQDELWKENRRMESLPKKEQLQPVSFVENPVAREREEAFEKSVEMPNVPGEIARSPEYKSYYQVIREKIRRLAYRNYRKLFEGEVFMTFAIDPKGNLLDISLKNEKSSSHTYLRDIALESVRDAAPYPPFPAKLSKNKKLTFNVIISFEIK